MKSDLRVWNISSLPLSWTDNFLLRYNLAKATSLHREHGPVKIVCLWKLLDPDGVLEALGGYLTDDPFKAQDCRNDPGG